MMRTISKIRFGFGVAVLAAGMPVVLFAALQSQLAAAETVTIHLTAANRYDPASQNIKAGDTVVWMNDAGTHTVTPNANQPDPFPGSQRLDPGQSYTVVISGDPRTIKYHCQIHGLAMSGTIVVTP